MSEKQDGDSNFDMSADWAAAIPDDDPSSLENLKPAEQIGRLEFRFQKMSEMIEDDGVEDTLRRRFSELEVKSTNLFKQITDSEELRQAQLDFAVISDIITKLDALKARMTEYKKTAMHLRHKQRLPLLRELVTDIHNFLRVTLLYLGDD